MREHRFTSAFKGDNRSPPGVPPSRGTRHSQNTRQFVDSVASQIDIQRNVQRASLANADRYTPPKTDDPIPLPFFLRAQNHAGVCESLARNAGSYPEKVVEGLVAPAAFREPDATVISIDSAKASLYPATED